nr:hypothetical protein [Tanacetum cinerariifolium]
MVKSSNPTQIRSPPDVNPKEELVTLDKPKSLLTCRPVEFTFDEITFTTNNEVSLIYPDHPNSDYFHIVSDFISKYCLREASTR